MVVPVVIESTQRGQHPPLTVFVPVLPSQRQGPLGLVEPTAEIPEPPIYIRENAADLAFTAGLMGWSMLDECYFASDDRARAAGVTISFEIAVLNRIASRSSVTPAIVWAVNRRCSSVPAPSMGAW